jgi:RNA polymerase sigma-70 factor (ECF subfamily)
MTAMAHVVDRARAGDREAFGELYAAYQPQVYAVVFHRTGDRQLAEDLTSETFARALARIETFTWQGRDIGAWLATIARNLVTDHFKSARTNRETPVGDMRDLDRTTGDPTDQVADDFARRDQAHAADDFARRDQAHAVRQAVAGLTGPQKEILRLRFWGELPFADIARTTGRTVSSAKMHRTRALDKLRRRLGPLAEAG